LTPSTHGSIGEVSISRRTIDNVEMSKLTLKDLSTITVDDIDRGLRLKGYIPDRSIVLAVYLALKLNHYSSRGNQAVVRQSLLKR
jgi:hypothetical protein